MMTEFRFDLGGKVSNLTRYTDEERELQNSAILKRYAEDDTATIAADIGLTVAAVRNRASQLGVKKASRSMTRKESARINSVIREAYRTEDHAKLAKRLGLNLNSLRTRANRLGVNTLPKRENRLKLRPLSLRRARALAASYADTCNHELAPKLRMSVSELQAYASAMSLRKCSSFLLTAKAPASMPRIRSKEVFVRRNS